MSVLGRTQCGRPNKASLNLFARQDNGMGLGDINYGYALDCSGNSCGNINSGNQSTNNSTAGIVFNGNTAVQCNTQPTPACLSYDCSQQECEGCPYSPTVTGFNYFCQSNWDGSAYTDPTTKAACCGGALSDSTNCDPTVCPQGGDGNDTNGCQQTMTTFCTPDVWGGVTQTGNFNGGWLCDNYAKSSNQANIFSSTNSNAAQGVIQASVSNFYTPISSGGLGHLPTDNHPFVTKAIEMCAQYPGTCDNILSNVCSQYSLDDLDASKNVSTWDPAGTNLLQTCGCFLPSNQYYLQNGMTVPCNTICNFPGTIPQGSTSGKAATCTGGTCVIDDVSIDMMNSYSGSINFNQICNTCQANQPCTCYLRDIDIQTQNSEYKTQTISGNCTSCFTLSDDTPPIATPIPCTGEVTPGGGGNGGYTPPSQPSEFSVWLGELLGNSLTWWVGGFVLVFIILLGIAYFV